MADAHARTTDTGLRSLNRWSVGFHGGLSRADLAEFPGMSVRDVALGRRSNGTGPLLDLTDLPEQLDRIVPLSVEGRHHVGINGSDQDAPVPRQGDGSDVLEPSAIDVEEYVFRRIEDARFIFLPNRGRGYAAAKRCIDLIGAIALLIITAPIMLLLAIMIRIDSPGPALFRQTRVTRGGRTFRFYKFRTMYVDASERFPELYAYRFSDSSFESSYYKLADDPRNTRVGRWLRRTTLDELPNLFNVVSGDLSLVGPRPELPELVLHYQPEELACFFTKAGLTGLAQVAGRSLLTVRERLTLDLRYVAHQTVLLDLRIMWRTLVVVVTGRGAF